MSDQKKFVLWAIKKLGALTPSQLSRFLFSPGLAAPFDLMSVLFELREEGCLEQNLSLNGIVYLLTEKGCGLLTPGILEVEMGGFEAIVTKYSDLFEKEKDYIAQYTEQANALCPVFLSLRRKNTILLHVNLVVDDVETAKNITEHWMQNAHKTYNAIWESISDGIPKPKIYE